MVSWLSVDPLTKHGLSLTAKRLERTFLDIEIIDGKLYAATCQAFEFLMVFDIHDPPSYKVERLVLLRPRPVRAMHQHDTRDGVVYIYNAELTYLAKDPTSNELLVIIIASLIVFLNRRIQ